MFIVTGANGFIGSQMVRFLNDQGLTNIICTDSISTTDRPQPLSQCEYQKFLNPDELFKFIETHKGDIQCIFHMGACSDTQEMDVNFLRNNNTDYTNKLFEFCTLNPQCTFIYASSGAVYGQGENGFSDNIDPKQLTPLNPYGWSKINSDIWVLEQKTWPKHWYGLRFFNVYGPNESHKKDMRSVVHKAYGQILETEKLKLFRSYHPDYKDGMQMRDFVYVKDIVGWMWQIYQNKGIQSGIYNMGYGRARTWKDLAIAVFDSLDKPVNIEWIDMPDILKDKYQYFTEAKMKKLLSQGLSTPKWSLESGVSDYVKNYLCKGE